jgi:carboxyl-terminal processing protease
MKNTIAHCLFMLLLSLSGCTEFLVEAPPLTTPTAIFDELWHDFDQRYALFDVNNVNWNSLYQFYRPRISDQMEDSVLAKTIDTLLRTLHDRHVSLYAYTTNKDYSFRYGQDYLDSAFEFNFNNVSSFYLRNTAQLTGYGEIAYGKIHDSIGYVYLRTFDENSGDYGWAKFFEQVIDSLQKTKGLILDIRSNEGGTQANIISIASHFFEKQSTVFYTQLRNGKSHNDFTASEPVIISPSDKIYLKPIVLVTDRFTVSAGEWFTLAIKTLPNVTHIGDTTTGAFSGRLDRELANGWLYSMSIEKITDIDGVSFEGRGIPPDFTIHLLKDYYSFGRDTTLDKAIELLSK